MRNAWDIQVPTGHGDQDEDKLYAAVGRALTRWEELEELLAELFAVFVGAPYTIYDSAHPASQAYCAIQSFSARTAVLDAAAEAFFKNAPHPESQSCYWDIIAQCRSFAARRNEIAHGTVWRDSDELGSYLIPAYYIGKKNKKGSAYQYTSKEIMHYADHFATLAATVADLHRHIKEMNIAPAT